MDPSPFSHFLADYPPNQLSMRVLEDKGGNIPDFLQDLNHPARLASLPLPREVVYKTFEERWKSGHDVSAARSPLTGCARPFPILCEFCQSLKIRPSDFSRESERKEGIYNLGSYESIAARDCPICRLVVRVIRTNETSWDRVQQNHSLHCGLVFSWSDHYEYHTLLQTTDFYQNKQPRGLAVFIDDDNTDSQAEYPKLFIENPKIEHFDSVTAFTEFKARVHDSRECDINLVKIWLGACNEWHGDTCEFASMLPGNMPVKLPFFRVVDVASLNLAHFNGVNESTYIALSYVWGRTNNFLTQSSDLTALSEPGGLGKVIERVPRTIRDAIHLTKQLGLKYLWVDSLCIVQDDPYDKAIFIREMHQIYHRSFLTIIAAAGDHADHGLPGVRLTARNPQNLEEIEPNFYLGVLPSYGTLIKESVHSTRAWTMQEACFARRRLTFFDNQMIFQCRRCIWREDLMAEIPGLRCNLSRYDNKMSLNDPPLFQFCNLLHQYTSRSLTYEIDIYDAFAGLKEFLKAVTGSEIRFGLVEKFMDWSVLWTQNTKLQRRKGFPSWSWLGWKGTIWSPNPPQGDKIHDWINRHCWINYKTMLLIKESDMKDESDDDVPILQFKTLCAIFGIGISESFSSENCWLYLMDSHGRRCGMVEVHDSAYLQKLQTAVKILVLSDAQPNDIIKIKNISLDYPVDDHEEESQTFNSSNTPTKYPVTPLSNHEHTTETGWMTGTHFDFHAFYAEKDRLALMGGEGPLGEHVYRSDTFTFDFYNVMMVLESEVATLARVGSGDGRAEDAEVWSINERVGLGLVHISAMHWALEPGPRIEDIWLR